LWGCGRGSLGSGNGDERFYGRVAEYGAWGVDVKTILRWEAWESELRHGWKILLVSVPRSVETAGSDGSGR
jgi:hypothetical protein